MPKSLRGLSIALTWLLVASALASAAAVGALVNRVHYADRLERRDFASIRELLDAGRAADEAVETAAALTVLLGVAVLVVLIVFLYRAARNTSSWDTSRPRWTPGWSIGGWFIPAANLVIPPLVVRDTWRRSPEVTSGASRPSTGIVWMWWVLFLGGTLTLRAVPGDGDTLDSLRTADTVGAIGAGALAVASVVLLVLVRRLADRQARLGAR